MGYDVVIIGSGMTGAVIARTLTDKGKRCLVVDKRSHVGGNCYSESKEGIEIHKYGAHIYRTNTLERVEYIKRYTDIENFINTPISITEKGALNLPFNMNTFAKLWGVVTPNEAKKVLAQKTKQFKKNNVRTLEEYALSEVGEEIYTLMIKGYTEKQWHKKCNELPKTIMSEIPVKFEYNNNYFNERYQFVPKNGYGVLFNNLLDGIDVILECDYKKNGNVLRDENIIVCTAPIDEFYDYEYGRLEYRSLRFEEKVLDCDNYQGVAVCNYPSSEVEWTRTIEHKHFVKKEYGNKTIVTFEYPCDYTNGNEPMYPIEDSRNSKIYNLYKQKAKGSNVVFCGRLGEYRYDNMDTAITNALVKAKEILNRLERE